MMRVVAGVLRSGLVAYLGLPLLLLCAFGPCKSPLSGRALRQQHLHWLIGVLLCDFV